MVAAPGSVKTFSCPNCSGTIEIRAVGISITAICGSCGSIIDTGNTNLQIIGQVKAKARNLNLPIGSRGVLFNHEWEVIGFTENCDASEHYYWGEYLLFNPWQGFRFLVESDEHWSFIKTIRDVEPRLYNTEYFLGTQEFEYQGENYRIFLRDTATVTYALGEFYWRVKIGERNNVADFIAPPYILSRQQYDEFSEVIWSHGVYIEPEEISDAFNLKKSLSSPYSIAPNQPSPTKPYAKNISYIFAGLFVLLFLLQSYLQSNAVNQVVFQQKIQMNAGNKDQIFTSEPFELKGGKSNVELSIYSEVYNHWLETDISLVKQDDLQTFENIQSTEYYTGVDSDGSWSEGNKGSSNIISAVPDGTYRLLISTNSDYPSGQSTDFTVNATRGVVMWSNFWLALVLIIILPLFVWLRSYMFESNRWKNSDFSPDIYKSSQSDA